MTRVRAWVDWCFRDRTTGRIVIVQLPNVALAVWLVAMTLRLLLESAPTTEKVRWVAAGALVVWGLEELPRGVNGVEARYWRGRSDLSDRGDRLAQVMRFPVVGFDAPITVEEPRRNCTVPK